MKEKVQLFGKSLLFPISLLSIMAIFLGLSSALQNEVVIQTFSFLDNEFVQNILKFIKTLAAIPFSYLPILFALAIPLGIVQKDKEVAVYSAFVGYISLLLSMQFVLSLLDITPETTNVDYLMSKIGGGFSQTDASIESSKYTQFLGIFVYNMNIIGGIIAGLVTVFIHNKFRNTELPAALSFYSGKRFVPIINLFVLSFIGILLVFIWPYLDLVIISIGNVISKLGAFGVFLYGFFEKLINPTGLHHILNETFRFTALGGTAEVNGETYVGALNIFFAQLDAGVPVSASATQYLAQGKFLHMMFGIPAICLALVLSADKVNRKKVFAYLLPGLLAAFLTGITEPVEFTFIFLSPILWIINAIFAGLSFLIPALIGVTIGNIQGGIIDFFVFGILQGLDTKWLTYLVTGPIMFAVYFFAFKLLISKLNINTIGRGNNKMLVDQDVDPRVTARRIIENLGGPQNISDVDNCISRLRIAVKDGSLVDEDMLKTLDTKGVIRPSDEMVHIVYGSSVTKMRNLVDEELEKMND